MATAAVHDWSLLKLLDTLTLTHLYDKFLDNGISSEMLPQLLIEDNQRLSNIATPNELEKLRASFSPDPTDDDVCILDELADVIKKNNKSMLYDGFRELDDNGFVQLTRTNQRNIVAVGKTGQGKSATLNSIMACADDFSEKFEEGLGMASVTDEIAERCIKINGKSVRLVDTIGLFDSNKSEQSVLRELSRCIVMCSEGIHCFLVVVDGSERFTDECKRAVKIVHKYFGSRLWDYAVVVITHGDELLLPKKRQESLNILRHSGIVPDKINQRHVFFDNKKRSKHQVDELMAIIEENLRAQNGPYTHVLFDEARARMKEEKRQAVKEVEEKRDNMIRQETAKIEEQCGRQINVLNEEIVKREDVMKQQQLVSQQMMNELNQAKQRMEEQTKDAKISAEQRKQLMDQLAEVNKQMLAVGEKDREREQQLQQQIIDMEEKIREAEEDKLYEIIKMKDQAFDKYSTEMTNRFRQLENQLATMQSEMNQPRGGGGKKCVIL